MLSTAAFFEAFDRAGFLHTALWRPSAGGPEQSAQVRFRAPSSDVLGGDQFSIDYTVCYPSTVLVGLKRGETITVAGRSFTVREDPESRFDGSLLEAKLSAV